MRIYGKSLASNKIFNLQFLKEIQKFQWEPVFHRDWHWTSIFHCAPAHKKLILTSDAKHSSLSLFLGGPCRQFQSIWHITWPRL